MPKTAENLYKILAIDSNNFFPFFLKSNTNKDRILQKFQRTN